MVKSIKKIVIAMFAVVSVCAAFLGGLTLKNAKADGETVTVSLNGGFIINGSDYKTDDIILTPTDKSIVLTRENVKTLLGGAEYVYRKASAGTFDGVTVNEDGTWSPVSDKELPEGMLFGLFYDENDNGIADENETVYRRGDNMPLVKGKTIKCYYEKKYVYAKVHMKNEVVLKRATEDLTGNLNAFQRIYTARDFQPLTANLTAIGMNAFTRAGSYDAASNWFNSKNFNNVTTSVEFPETVTQIRDEAFLMCGNLSNITGLKNVELVGARAFILCGQNTNQSETMFLEFGDNVKALGNMKAVDDSIGGANNRGSVFAVNRSNVRIIFNGKGTESSPLQTPAANVSQFQTKGVEDFFVYVPKGTTDAWYPTDNFAERMKDETTKKAVGMREMVRINYDLNGGNVEGKTTVKTQYLDYGAAEVMRDGKEVNILAHNPAAQDFSKLNTVKFVSPAKHASVFSHWETNSGEKWKEADFKNEQKLKTLTEDTVFKAVWIDSIGSVTIDFNGGFHASGETTSDENFEHHFTEETLVLTPENARKIVGYELVCLKGEPRRYKDGIEIAADGTFVPRNDAAIPTGLAFGLFYDDNDNGIPDGNETLYKSGDAITLKNGKTLKVYYEHNLTFAKRAAEGEVTVKRATSGYDGDALNAFKEVYEVELFKPLLSETVKIGESAFTGYKLKITDTIKAEDYIFDLGHNNITTSVELPDTVREIDKDAFMYVQKLSHISGLDSVESLGYRAFVQSGRMVDSSETLYFVFGENVRSVGSNTGGNVFSIYRQNVRVIFNGSAEAGSPLNAPGNREDVRNLNFHTNNMTETFFVYVPKGTTANWYPSEEKYGAIMKDGGSSPSRLVCIREMYRINYDLNGGTYNGKDEVERGYVDAGAVSVLRGENQEVNLTDYNPSARDLKLLNTVDSKLEPVKSGLIFEYWLDQNGNKWTCEDLSDESKLSTLTEDLRLTAFYDNGLSVKLHFNNGQSDYVSNVRYKAAITDYVIHPVSCYYFAGWYKAEDLSDDSFYGLTIDSVREDLELYAKYNPIECSAKLYLTGGTYNGKISEYIPFSFKYGNESALPNVSGESSLIKRNGYTFVGWYDNDDFSGDPVTNIPSDEYAPTYYAKWESESSFANIEYELNGGENPSDAPTKYTVGDETTLPVPEKYGYSFKGWYLAADFNSGYIEKIDVTFSGDVKLYACWRDNNLKSIAYVLNGGHNNENNVEEFSAGDRIVLYSPTRKNYAFEGWYTSENYDEASKVEVLTIGEDITLYAKWKKVAEDAPEDSTVTPTKKPWTKFTFQFTCGCIVIAGFLISMLVLKKFKSKE